MNVERIKGLLRDMGFVFLMLGLIIAIYYIPQATSYTGDTSTIIA